MEASSMFQLTNIMNPQTTQQLPRRSTPSTICFLKACDYGTGFGLDSQHHTNNRDYHHGNNDNDDDNDNDNDNNHDNDNDNDSASIDLTIDNLLNDPIHEVELDLEDLFCPADKNNHNQNHTEQNGNSSSWDALKCLAGKSGSDDMFGMNHNSFSTIDTGEITDHTYEDDAQWDDADQNSNVPRDEVLPYMADREPVMHICNLGALLNTASTTATGTASTTAKTTNTGNHTVNHEQQQQHQQTFSGSASTSVSGSVTSRKRRFSAAAGVLKTFLEEHNFPTSVNETYGDNFDNTDNNDTEQGIHQWQTGLDPYAPAHIFKSDHDGNAVGVALRDNDTGSAVLAGPTSETTIQRDIDKLTPRFARQTIRCDIEEELQQHRIVKRLRLGRDGDSSGMKPMPQKTPKIVQET